MVGVRGRPVAGGGHVCLVRVLALLVDRLLRLLLLLLLLLLLACQLLLLRRRQRGGCTLGCGPALSCAGRAMASSG